MDAGVGQFAVGLQVYQLCETGEYSREERGDEVRIETV